MFDELERKVGSARDALRGFARKVEEARDEGRLGEMAAEGRRRIMKPFYGGTSHETENHDQD